MVFTSTAGNLARTSSNTLYTWPGQPKVNIFIRDRLANFTQLVSVDTNGTAPANVNCAPVAVSTNGQFVLFESSAGNLAAEVAGLTNPVSAAGIYLRDVVNGITTLVNADTNSPLGIAPFSTSTMTPDGLYVAFSTRANELAPGDSNLISDIYVRNMQTGVFTLASPGAQRPFGQFPSLSAGSYQPVLTPDGRYVLFESSAVDLVPGVTNVGEIYLRDTEAQTTCVVSTNAHSYISSSISYHDHTAPIPKIIPVQLNLLRSGS